MQKWERVTEEEMDSNRQQHAFAQPSLSPTNFYNGLDLSPPHQGGPRSYKSRRDRPCDFCRLRQVACKIDVSPPCKLCAHHDKQCTFLDRPKKKRRPTNATTANSNGEASGSGASSGTWAKADTTVI